MISRLLSRLPLRRRIKEDPSSTTDILQEIRRLEIRTRGFVESLFSGEYLSVFIGRGMEFSHVRSYQFGDDVRAIDWKVTARRGSPYVRQFVEERDLLVVLVVDVSASGRRGPGSRSAAEVAAEIAGALTFAAARNNDRQALLLVSDRVEHYLPPGSGRKHAVRLLTELLTHTPQSAATELTPAFERLARAIPGRATVFFISDFIQGPSAAVFPEAVRRAARAHDIVAVRLSSQSTLELPDVGWVELTDPETGRRIVIDSSSARVRRRYRERAQAAAAETMTILSDAGVDILDVDTDGDPLSVLTEFFRTRRAAIR